MTYKVQMRSSAVKELSQLDKTTIKRIDTHIRALANNPRPPGVVAMKGSSRGLFRIIVGKYRIIYDVRDNEFIILIVKIGHRREIYR